MLDPQQPFREAYPTSFPYFSDLGFDKNIERIEKLDDYTVRFDLKTPDVIFVRNLAMSFASILSAEYAVQLSAAHRGAAYPAGRHREAQNGVQTAPLDDAKSDGNDVGGALAHCETGRLGRSEFAGATGYGASRSRTTGWPPDSGQRRNEHPIFNIMQIIA